MPGIESETMKSLFLFIQGCRVILLMSFCFAIKGRADNFLTFENRSKSLLKGCYHQNNSLALCFQIQPELLQLTDNKSKVLVRYRKLPKQRFHAQVLDDKFVWHHSAEEPVFMKLDKIRGSSADTFAPGLSNDAIKEISPAMYHSAMAKLQRKQEIQLLARVSHALHDATNHYAITKPFHVMLMSLLTEHDARTPEHDQENAGSYHHRYLKHFYNRKRGYCKDLRSDPYNNRCLGMCGPKCWCWSLVCSDCCYHKGCYEHDLCCQHKKLSAYCLLPFFHRFRCKSYGGYPRCL